MRPARTAAGAIAIAAAAGLALAGCTTSGHPSAASSQSTPTSPPTAATDTGSAPASDTPSTITSAPTTTASSAPRTSISVPVPPRGSCTAAQLTVRVLSASAAQQQEFAVATFTNSGTSSCTLFGFPGISLRSGGALMVTADRTTDVARTVTLAPGEQGEAMITDFSSCQAGLSDTVRVYPPNLTTFVDRPLQLRGCKLQVGPVTKSQ